MLVAWLSSPGSSGHPFTPQEPTPANLKIAFIGDQALGPNSVAVLNLIKSEGAQAVMHSGDLDYTDNPAAWEAQVNSVLGSNFPYFVAIGNHDELAWRGAAGYQQYVINRFNRVGITWTGDLGVQSTFHYKGLFFVITAPGISSGFDSGNSDTYIKDQLAADNSVWSICSWHKDMKLMQVGGKEDETGWGVYEEARKGGAVIATGHEHSYSRTHLLSSMMNQTVAGTSNTLTLTKGNSFAFVSGLGGNSVRPQLLSGPWWASISAATCLAGDPVCQPEGNFGALFGVFNVDDQPNKASFYFKDISGRIVDSFTVISNIELPVVTGLSPDRVQAGSGSFVLTVNGANFGTNSIVRWNNVNKPTTFVSPTQLTATISSADIGAAGTVLVTVSGPGGTSNNATFTIDPAPPIITALQPSSVEAGSNGFTLIVNGANFLNASVVRWNGANRPTSFIASSQLTATISSADIAAAGTTLVTVSGSSGISNSATFTIKPPQVITALQPASVEAGGSAFTLTVNGANFELTSIVRWNNVDKPTTFVSSSQLTAMISSADIAAVGTVLVTVSRPSGTSNSMTFTIIPPQPIITALQPASVEAGSDAFALTVNGDNFLSSSMVRWNGVNRPTTFISATQLTASISVADVASTGLVSVTISNPEGTSKPATFTVAPPSLILFTETNSERAIALDSVTLIRDPFLISTTANFSSDRRTRIMIFSPNLSLMPADSFSSVSAQAEDSQHITYPLTVEFVGKTPQYDWLTQIVLRLPDHVGDTNVLWVKITYRGAISNKALISLK